MAPLKKRGNKYSLLWIIQRTQFHTGTFCKEYVTLIYLFLAPFLEDVLSYVKNKQWYVVQDIFRIYLKGTSKENKTEITFSLQTHIYLCKVRSFLDPINPRGNF